MRRNGNLAIDYAQRHHVPFWTDKMDELIHHPEVNAVYIATPPDKHAEYAIRAMRAGKPVYVEKPMARNYAECREMIRISGETKVPLFVAYYRRGMAYFLKVKALLDEQSIGNVRLVNVRLFRPIQSNELDPENLPWRLIPEIAGGGHFFDLASHTLDFLDDALGPIEKVQGIAMNQAGKYPAEDIVVGNWVHKNGVAGNGTWCFSASSIVESDCVEIIGDKGRILFSTFGFTPIILETEELREEFHFERPEHVQMGLIQKVVETLLGIGTCPGDGMSAARTSWVMDQMVENFYSK